MNLGNILFGIPAQSLPILASDANINPIPRIKETSVNGFVSIFNEFINNLLLSLCITLSANFSMFATTAPVILLIYSLITSIIYRYLVNIPISDDFRSNYCSSLTWTLSYYYKMWFGYLLGGTQWLCVVLRQFGAKIDDDVIIEDMSCLFDIHLTTINSHVRVSSTSRIQVNSITII